MDYEEVSAGAAPRSYLFSSINLLSKSSVLVNGERQLSLLVVSVHLMSSDFREGYIAEIALY